MARESVDRSAYVLTYVSTYLGRTSLPLVYIARGTWTVLQGRVSVSPSLIAAVGNRRLAATIRAIALRGWYGRATDAFWDEYASWRERESATNRARNRYTYFFSLSFRWSRNAIWRTDENRFALVVKENEYLEFPRVNRESQLTCAWLALLQRDLRGAVKRKCGNKSLFRSMIPFLFYVNSSTFPMY